VKQNAADSTKVDSTVFRMPVTIRVGTRPGTFVRRVELAAREQTIEIASACRRADMVVFDDGNTILKELTFDQPTLLARHPAQTGSRSLETVSGRSSSAVMAARAHLCRVSRSAAATGAAAARRR